MTRDLPNGGAAAPDSGSVGKPSQEQVRAACDFALAMA